MTYMTRKFPKTLRKKQLAAVEDEKKGAKEYEDLARMEEETPHWMHKSHAKKYREHAADERRHEKEDRRIQVFDEENNPDNQE